VGHASGALAGSGGTDYDGAVADPEHVAVVKGGTAAIRQWNAEHDFPPTMLDLRGADLRGADLRGANLRRALLFDADLSQARLSNAFLRFAVLMGASLSGADLLGTHLSRAQLHRANLSDAKLVHTDLSYARLWGADLTGANLNDAILAHTEFRDADLTRTKLYRTVLLGCDLGRCKGLDAVEHEAPSYVATDTLVASFRGAGNVLTADLITFFRGTGVPQEWLATLPRSMAEVQYDSCFISYGEPDRATAERLNGDLKARGINCWTYALDATPGRRTRHEIKSMLSEADRVVVLCSHRALVREGVLDELADVIDDDPEKLVPVSLDDDWKHPGFRVMRGTRDLGPWLRERNYADFGTLGYDEGLHRLLKALTRPAAPPSP
jgi:TIR domain/Pentapeptide repeats (8 copies)